MLNAVSLVLASRRLSFFAEHWHKIVEGQKRLKSED